MPLYESLLKPYRALNKRRTLRRIGVSGFRLFNTDVINARTRAIFQDVYVSGMYPAATLYCEIAKVVMQGRQFISFVADFKGGARKRQEILYMATTSHFWSTQWTQELERQDAKCFRVRYHIPYRHLPDFFVMVLCLLGNDMTYFAASNTNFCIDFEITWDDIKRRHQYEDVNLILEGARIRRVQRFGRLYKSTRRPNVSLQITIATTRKIKHLTQENLSIRELYEWAERVRLLDAPIRICDGMAVSFYPRPICLATGRYEIIIDISGLDPVEYDDLPERRDYAIDIIDEDELPQRLHTEPIEQRKDETDALPW